MPSQPKTPQAATTTPENDQNTTAPRDSLKSQTARTNGAKSRGPITAAGRAKSSRNSLRHGLSAKSVVLPTESAEQFQLLPDSYLDQFHPQTPVEMELVEVMAASRWRLRRICAIETRLLNTELVRRAEDIDNEFINMDDEARLAWVFQKLADHGQTLALLTRYEAALNRGYDRAFKQLNVLQRSPPTGPTNLPQQNEPTPDPALSASTLTACPLANARGSVSALRAISHLPNRDRQEAGYRNSETIYCAESEVHRTNHVTQVHAKTQTPQRKPSPFFLAAFASLRER